MRVHSFPLFAQSCRRGEDNYHGHELVLFNTLRLRQTGRHFPDDIFKCIFLNETDWISIQISSNFVSSVQIDNKPALVQTMAWLLTEDNPLSEPMMAYFINAYMRQSASMS